MPNSVFEHTGAFEKYLHIYGLASKSQERVTPNPRLLLTRSGDEVVGLYTNTILISNRSTQKRYTRLGTLYYIHFKIAQKGAKNIPF